MPNEFVIFCTARTGSYSLVSRLNSAPDIICHGEVFKNHAIEVEASRKKRLLRFTSTETRNADPVGYISDLRALDPDRHFGFKFFAQHQRWADIGSFLKAPNTKRVILYRDPIGVYGSLLRAKSSGEWLVLEPLRDEKKAGWRNRLFAFVSGKKKESEELGGALSTRQERPQTKAHFTPESFERFMNAYESFAKRAVSLSTLDNSFVIDYDQINAEAVIDELLRFLGSSAKFADTMTGLSKQNPGSDADGFSNWDELQDYLARTGRRINGPQPTCQV